MGVTGVPTANLVFDACRVPVGNLVGEEEGRGFRTAMLTLNCCRPVVGARGLGLAEGCLAYAVDFARQRRTFGRPILEHQAIQMLWRTWRSWWRPLAIWSITPPGWWTRASTSGSTPLPLGR